MVGFFFQAEDGIRDLVRSRGLGDVYKRQATTNAPGNPSARPISLTGRDTHLMTPCTSMTLCACLLYTSDAADERSSVDLGRRRIIKKKNNIDQRSAIDIRQVYDAGHDLQTDHSTT